MASRERWDLQRYLDRVRALPFVTSLAVRASHSYSDPWDALLALRTPRGEHDLALTLRKSPLTRSGAEHLLTRVARDTRHPWLVLSPFVSAAVGELLASQGVGFLDQAGNCHVAIGRDYLAHVEGRRPPPRPREGRGLGPRSYQIVFALLADPALAASPIRMIAETAGVRKTAAADMLRRLEEEGSVIRDRTGRRLARPKQLLDRWLVGYGDTLRPRLLVGRYRSPDKVPQMLRKRIEAALRTRSDWVWGGASAELLMTHHYRSDMTTLHLAAPLGDLDRRLHLLPAADGPLIILGLPGPLGLKGPVPHVAHPLLVYTELVAEGGDRAREAAAEVRERYLGHLE